MVSSHVKNPILCAATPFFVGDVWRDDRRPQALWKSWTPLAAPGPCEDCVQKACWLMVYRGLTTEYTQRWNQVGTCHSISRLRLELIGIVTQEKKHRIGHGLVPVSSVLRYSSFVIYIIYYLTLIEILVGYLYVKRREQPSPQFSVAPKGDTHCNNFALFGSVHYVQ